MDVHPDRLATVVAFLGARKPPVLTAVVAGVGRVLAEGLGAGFRARPIDDVHATLVGLERIGPLPAGREAAELRARLPGAPGNDRTGLADHVESELTAHPLTIRFGAAAGDAGRTSRGVGLFERSITIGGGGVTLGGGGVTLGGGGVTLGGGGATGGSKVVLIGWALDAASGAPSGLLDRLRRDAGRFGAVHRYLTGPGSTDPDAYLVVGELLGRPDPAVLAAALHRARAGLAAAPARVPLGPAELAVALYTDDRLPAATTTVLGLDRL